MKEMIANSLLRMDGVTGQPPEPFERPNNKFDFFVLELGIDEEVESWCARTTDTLKRHADLIEQMRQRGAKATLHIDHESTPVLTLDASFLRVLAEAGISLECSGGCISA